MVNCDQEALEQSIVVLLKVKAEMVVEVEVSFV